MLDITNNHIELINKYDIRFSGIFAFINDEYKQEILFVNNKIVANQNEYEIYIDENLNTNYRLSIDEINNKYYIYSPIYLSNNIKSIYTKTTNYYKSILKESRTKKNKYLQR
jgi:hypothetical protein